MLFERTKIVDDFSQTNKLVYGFPKTGKTTFCSHMKSHDGREPLFIATEDGHKALSVFLQRVTSWDGFINLLDDLEANKQTIVAEHSCIVIDILSDLDLWLTRKICTDYKATHLYDEKKFPFGKGSTIHKTNFQAAMLRLFNISPVSFIAHSKEKEVMWEGDKIKVQSPSLSTGVMEFVNGKVDLIGWVSPSRMGKETPRIIFKGSDTCLAGSRYKCLAREFVFNPEDPGETYREMEQTFLNNIA